MSNYTAVATKVQAPVWLVDYSGEVVETESHDAVKLALRDRDGKFAPQEKPVTKKQATRKLEAKSQRLNSAIDRMQAMESW